MAGDVSVRFLNEEAVLERIRGLANEIGIEGGRPQKVVAMEAIKGIQQGFREAISPEGVPWKGLKSRIGGKPLQDHRVLYQSITSEIHGPTVTVCTNDKRANTLHYGGRISPRGQYLSIMLPGMASRGGLRAAYPGAFVLKLGGSSYGYDRLWLVRKTEDIAGLGHTYTRKSDGKSVPRNQNVRNSQKVDGHGKLQFIALLVKYVDEPGRPFIGLSLNTQDNIVKRLGELAWKAWGNAGAGSTD